MSKMNQYLEVIQEINAAKRNGYGIAAQYAWNDERDLEHAYKMLGYLQGDGAEFNVTAAQKALNTMARQAKRTG